MPTEGDGAGTRGDTVMYPLRDPKSWRAAGHSLPREPLEGLPQPHPGLGSQPPHLQGTHAVAAELSTVLRPRSPQRGAACVAPTASSAHDEMAVLAASGALAWAGGSLGRAWPVGSSKPCWPRPASASSILCSTSPTISQVFSSSGPWRPRGGPCAGDKHCVDEEKQTSEQGRVTGEGATHWDLPQGSDSGPVLSCFPGPRPWARAVLAALSPFILFPHSLPPHSHTPAWPGGYILETPTPRGQVHSPAPGS